MNVISKSFDIVPFLAPIAAVLIGGVITWIVYVYQSRQQREVAQYQKKQHELTGVMEAFKILNNDRHRQAREDVYSAFKQYEDGTINIFENESVRKNAAMVRADFDEIGLLVDNGLIPKDVFFKSYLNTVIICWKALKTDIEKQRKDRKYPEYMTYFQKLYEGAEDYANDNKIDTSNWHPYFKKGPAIK